MIHIYVTYQHTYYFCQHFDELKKWGTSLRSRGNQLDFQGKYLPLSIFSLNSFPMSWPDLRARYCSASSSGSCLISLISISAISMGFDGKTRSSMSTFSSKSMFAIIANSSGCLQNRSTTFQFNKLFFRGFTGL